MLNVASSNCSPLWHEFRSCLLVFCAFASFRVRNWEQTIFWENRWTNDIALKYALRYLYKLAVGKKLTVVRTLFKFKRNVQGLFMSFDLTTPTTNKIFHQLHEFNIIMESLVLSSDDDSISWPASSDNFFSVKSYYALLNDGSLRSQHDNDIWKCNASFKIKVFT